VDRPQESLKKILKNPQELTETEFLESFLRRPQDSLKKILKNPQELSETEFLESFLRPKA